MDDREGSQVEEPTSTEPEDEEQDTGYFAARDKVVEFAKSHPTLVATGALALVVVLKLVLVTRGNLTTAMALVAAAGPVEVGLGSVLALMQVLMMFLLVNGLLDAAEVIRGRRRVGLPLLLFLWVLPVAFFFMTLKLAIAVAVLTSLLLALAWLFARFAKRNRPSPLVDGATWAIIIFSMFLQNERPWWPAEVVSHQPDEVVVGYVVNQEEGWTTILREEDRQVLRVPTDAIEHRELCATGSEGDEPDLDSDGDEPILDTWLTEGDSPEYPECDSAAEQVEEDLAG